ncbi:MULTISPECIES: Hsp70 family protein [Streptomyces]|uniref:Hsp70 family protein n=1 Tax=Streptomyces flavovirens TaxID=52258 RepID=A0ABV8NE88_9ACTN|nr:MULTISPECIES: Hsp70 family protein [unclassified Streptomyces]MBK3596602.1 Hsp70 family protein [Streptomyces sp. MBT51]
MTATGIDFGTTNSVVAQWHGDDVEVLPLDAHHIDADWRHPGFEHLFPSVVGVSSLRRGPLFGWEAKVRSEEAVEACKRMLKSDEYVTVQGRRFAATTVAAGVFGAMREGARENLTEIDRAVITVPANATGAARYRTRAAARFAGIDVQALLNEPTAAAISYVHEAKKDCQLVVFDWGGGTIDVTVLDYTDGFFEERVSRGVTELGGLEIDRRLRDLVLQRSPARTEWSTAQRRQFRLDIERGKILLSSQPSVRIHTPDGRSVEVFQQELEEAIGDLVDRALAPLQQCLDELRMAPSDVDDILMIGGTSQIPSVRAAVAEVLQNDPVPTALCDPLTEVARGASIASAILAREIEAEITVASSHALGTVVHDASGQRKFSQVIPRNSPLPWSERKSYTPKKDNIHRLSLEIWEGDPDKDLDDPDNVKLTELSLKYPERRSRKESSFLLEYTYDTDGLLHVKAILEHTGQTVLDEPVRSFGSGGPTPEVREELESLLALAPAPAVTAAVHPAETGRPVSVVPTPRTGDDGPTTLVVDGSNLAWIGHSPRRIGVYEEADRPSYAQLTAAIEALKKKFSRADIHVVVDATFRHRVAPEERDAVVEALAKGDLSQPPAGTEGKGDALVAAIADEYEGVVVTNDNFAELQDRHTWLTEEGRVIGATLTKGAWIFIPRVCVPRRPRVGHRRNA